MAPLFHQGVRGFGDADRYRTSSRLERLYDHSLDIVPSQWVTRSRGDALRHIVPLEAFDREWDRCRGEGPRANECNLRVLVATHKRGEVHEIDHSLHDCTHWTMVPCAHSDHDWSNAGQTKLRADHPNPCHPAYGELVAGLLDPNCPASDLLLFAWELPEIVLQNPSWPLAAMLDPERAAHVEGLARGHRERGALAFYPNRQVSVEEAGEALRPYRAAEPTDLSWLLAKESA